VAELQPRTVFERAASAPVTRGVGDDRNDGGEWALGQNDSRKLAGIYWITISAAQAAKSEWELFAGAHDSACDSRETDPQTVECDEPHRTQTLQQADRGSRPGIPA
jgi:hypothetical protein